MPTEKNKYGLSRPIRSGVKREVRQRDGFGCVICGKAIFIYEHFDPEFANAKFHNSDGITLLCGFHEDLKTRGLLSFETLKDAIRSPKCKESGLSFGPFDVRGNQIRLGKIVCSNIVHVITIDDEPILSILPPERKGLPFRLSAHLRGQDGRTILKVVDNEWQSPISNWDVEVKGKRIIIRQSHGNINLILRSEPSTGITIEKLNMLHKGYSLRCDEGGDVAIELSTGEKAVFSNSCEISDFYSVIEIKNARIDIGRSRKSAFDYFRSIDCVLPQENYRLATTPVDSW